MRRDDAHLGVGAFAEDGGADADGGGTFFDGNGEIVGHAHGELGESGMGGEVFIPEAAQVLEVRAGGFGVFAPWRDGHQAGGLEIGERSERGEECGKLLGVEAVLGGLVREFDFDEDGESFVEGACGVVEALGCFERVDGVDGLEEFGGFGGLVVLQSADEVNFDVRDRIGESL